MSRETREKERRRYLSAGLRHLRDARTLLEHPEPEKRSFDQVWHLAGYGPECLRNACIEEEWIARGLSHDQSGMWWRWLLSLSRESKIAFQTQTRRAALWRTEHRYEETGTRSHDQAAAFLEACEEETTRILLALWLDGKVRDLRL